MKLFGLGFGALDGGRLLGGIAAPVTIVRGASTDAPALPEFPRTVRLVTLPGSHHVHLDSPAALAALLAETAGLR